MFRRVLFLSAVLATASAPALANLALATKHNCTACHAVELANAGPGITLLISGGAGSVSQYALQFAKARGATVITTVSSEDKARIAREAGADHCIDYKREDVGARVSELTGGRGVDAILEMDLAANAKFIPVTLRPKGSVIVYGTQPEATIPAMFCLQNAIKLQFFLVYQLDAAERQRAVTAINRALEQGKLINRVGPTFKLADTAAAHEAVERGTIGNVIVTMA